tara:strand:+ start:64961 stop:65404 length:444 start_codon:yes stop_codon:yes gene_type:complete
MKTTLGNKTIDSTMFSVPEFNFGQMQRWKGHTRLRYSIEIDISFFIERFQSEFAAFRENEIIEDDPEDLEELIAYEKAGRPTLLELLENKSQLLKELIMYHEYEILHLLINNPIVGKLFYSINSIDTVGFNKSKIQLEGVCFEIDRN